MNKKKLLALLMALVMTFSLIPTTVWAGTDDDTTTPAETESAPAAEKPEDCPEASIEYKNAAELADLYNQLLGSDTYTEENVTALLGNLSVSDLSSDSSEQWITNMFGNGIARIGENGLEDFSQINGFNTATDGVFVFNAVDTDSETMNKYGSYLCDFVVSFDKDVAADSVILVGYYGNMVLPILLGMDFQGNYQTKQYLVSTAMTAFDYNAIVNTVGTFICAAMNISPENIGTTINVSLRMWPATGDKETDSFEVANKTFKFDDSNLFWVKNNSTGTKYYHYNSGLHEGAMTVGDDTLVSTPTPGPHFAPEGAATYVAQIGEQGYETLEAAIEAANLLDTNPTVTLLQDVTVNTGSNNDSRLAISKSMTIDGDGHTISINHYGFGVGMDATGNIDVTFKDVTIENSSKAARCIDTRGNIGTLTLDHVKLSTDGAPSGYTQPLTIAGSQSTAATINITNSTIQTKDDATAYYAIITFNPVNMTIDHSTIKGWGCIYLKSGSAGSTVSIERSNLVSKNIYSGTSNRFSAIHFESPNVNVTVESSTIDIAATGDSLQGVTCFAYGPDTTGSVVTLGEGNKVSLTGENATIAVYSGNYHSSYGINGKVAVSGGLFSEPVDDAYCADGYICVANPDTETNTDYPYMVKAGTLVAEVWRPDEEHEGCYNYVGGYETLQAAIDAAADGDIVELLADVQLSQGVDVGKDVTLDLNGKTISNASDITTDYLLDVLHGGTLTVDDSSEASSGKISMDKQFCAIKMTKAGITADFIANNPSTLIVNAGTIEGPNYAISGNGNDNRGNSVITINGGTIRSTAGTAIYQPNTGVVTLNGGTITGLTGVEVRSGSLNIPEDSTAVITGTGTPASISGNGNGTTTDGAGVAIAQHTTHHDIDVAIAGGTISGQYSLAIVNPNNQTQGNINASVTGGKFSGNLEVTETRVSNFISGGIFSVEPAPAYIATGYQAIANTEAGTSADYPYTIGKVQVTEKADATVTVTVDKQVDFTDSSVPQVVKDNSDLKASINTNTSVSGVALTNNLVGGTNGLQDVVNAAEVKKPELTAALTNATTVEVKVDVTVVPKEYDAGKTFTFSLTPTATVTTKDENGATTATVSGVEVDNTMIDQTQDIEVTLYTGFEPALLTHRDDQGNVIGSYTKGDTASDSTFTYDDATGTCKLIIHHFSTIEATASSGAASVEFEGGSLRRRVWRGTQDVVSHETDFRMKFAFSLPVGAQIELNDSYFYWSTSNENPTANDRKVKVNSIKTEQITVDDKTYSNWAALILTGVPRESFGTTIYCKLHLVYTLNDKTYEVEVNQGVSVNDIANYLAGLTDTPANRPWIDYGHYLLQDEHAPATYNINAYNNNN